MATAPHVDEEHRALDHALADVEFLAERRSFKAASERFAEFRQAFEAHLREEETVVFPEFEKQTGDPEHVLPAIRAQHAELESALSSIGKALAELNYTEFCHQLDALTSLLKEHQATEERLLPAKEGAQPFIPAS